MARIRTVKPEFFKDDELAELGPYAMLLFEGLWCLADCDGRLEDRPRRIKVEILPYFDIDVEDLLRQLHETGFIVRYEAGGDSLIWIPKFREHQRITGKEAESTSKYPPVPRIEPEETTGNEGEDAGKQRGNNMETTETTGKERKGIYTDTNVSGAGAPAEEPKDRQPNHAFDPVQRVLEQVHQQLGWNPPTRQDVTTGLKPESGINLLIDEFGEDDTVRMFVWAHANWTKPPTWPAIYRQRNQLREQMEAKPRQPGRQPRVLTPDEIDEMRRAA